MIITLLMGCFASCAKDNSVMPFYHKPPVPVMSTLTGKWSLASLTDWGEQDSILYNSLVLNSNNGIVTSVNVSGLLGFDSFPYACIVIYNTPSDSTTVGLYYVTPDSLYGSVYGSQIRRATTLPYATTFEYHCYMLRLSPH